MTSDANVGGRWSSHSRHNICLIWKSVAHIEDRTIRIKSSDKKSATGRGLLHYLLTLSYRHAVGALPWLYRQVMSTNRANSAHWPLCVSSLNFWSLLTLQGFYFASSAFSSLFAITAGPFICLRWESDILTLSFEVRSMELDGRVTFQCCFLQKASYCLLHIWTSEIRGFFAIKCKN